MNKEQRTSIWWFLLAAGLLLVCLIKAHGQTKIFEDRANQRRNRELQNEIDSLAATNAPIYSNSVTLEWDASVAISNQVAGYRIYSISNWGQLFVTGRIFVVTNGLICYITNLFGTNYFTATAFDTNGLESDRSNIVTNRSLTVAPKFNYAVYSQTSSVVTGPFVDYKLIGYISNSPNLFFKIRSAAEIAP